MKSIVDHITEVGRLAGGVAAVLSVIAIVSKCLTSLWRRIRGNCPPLMPTIEESDQFWTPRDRNPISARLR
jgi:hypothetical protein